MARMQVVIDARKAKSGAKTFNRSVKSMGKSAKKTQKTFMSLKNALVGVFTVGAVFLGIRKTIGAISEQERVLSRLNIALKTTGGVSGQTVQSLTRFSAEMQKTTGIANELVEASQGILLSFTNISGDVFPRTMKAAMDIAEVMGTDLKTQIVQLGKALNDPIANLGALGRTGIQFTKSQKAMIKTLIDSNRLMDAQNIILQEIEKQYGGTAEAARDTLGGAIKALSSEYDDLFKIAGRGGVGGALREMVEIMVDVVEWINKGEDAVSDLALGFLFFENEWLKGWRTIATIAETEVKIIKEIVNDIKDIFTFKEIKETIKGKPSKKVKGLFDFYFKKARQGPFAELIPEILGGKEPLIAPVDPAVDQLKEELSLLERLKAIRAEGIALRKADRDNMDEAFRVAVAALLNRAKAREELNDKIEETIKKGKKDAEQMKKIATIADGVGRSFGAAFEKMVFGARSASEAIRELLIDVARLVVRQTFTIPISQAVSSMIQGTPAPIPTGGTGPSSFSATPTSPAVAGKKSFGNVTNINITAMDSQDVFRAITKSPQTLKAISGANKILNVR